MCEKFKGAKKSKRRAREKRQLGKKYANVKDEQKLVQGIR
jgi:hypothetical protein